MSWACPLSCISSTEGPSSLVAETRGWSTSLGLLCRAWPLATCWPRLAAPMVRGSRILRPLAAGRRG